MSLNCNENLLQVPDNPNGATKNVVYNIINGIYPIMIGVRNKLLKYNGSLLEEDISKLKDVYALCVSQIKKCLQSLFEIFKTEHNEHVSLQDSRQCTLERLSWCLNKLKAVELTIDNHDGNLNDSLLNTPIYFVNWIDHTFEILTKLAALIYKTDYKLTENTYALWKTELMECVTSLHIALDELLLSAMTLCKYCLPSDQLIVKARCQVVLRETKALLSELIDGDLDGKFKVTTEKLKLPIMPSNVNVLIDVLKDVLYVLETNTNTALLALVIHCFTSNLAPVDVLSNHISNTNGTCSCHLRNDNEITEDCLFVKEFDLYNERLLQIGSFAVSCSSDQSRILTLRSGLASLEALDPHLVPAVMLCPRGPHARLLVTSWRQEVQEIRDSIFLIVDPAAFAEKSKQMIHQHLVELTKAAVYDNGLVCAVINIGCVVLDFFAVYDRLEPDALTNRDQLTPLLKDLEKVQLECKVVSDLLTSGDDFVYHAKKIREKKVTFDQLIKRLKLLYTLIGRINTLLHPKDNDDLFECEVENEIPKNLTRTVVRTNINTYVQSPRKPLNISRSIFARTTNTRSSTNKFPLQKLTKHLNLETKKSEELSFSLQLDEIFNLTEVNGNRTGNRSKLFTKLQSFRESSILYNFSPNKRSSLRKAVLNRRYKMPLESGVGNNNVETVEMSQGSEKESLMDEATSLQITDILNQMSDMTNAFSNGRQITQEDLAGPSKGNVLKIDINPNKNTTMSISKNIWNIPVNSSFIETSVNNSSETSASNITAPSNVTTLERITDIEFLESKLNNLKFMDLETSL